MTHSRKRNFISLFMGLFMWAQLFSLCGAIESFSCLSLDDIDPEDIVTMDPFLCTTQVRLELSEQSLIGPALAATLCCLLLFVAKFSIDISANIRLCRSNLLFAFESNKIWLRHRRLLI